MHQIGSFKGCETFDAVSKQYLKLIPKNRKVVVVFDGYGPSTKDHEHRRRVKDFCSDMSIKKTTVCTVGKKKLFSNKNNKTELINLLSTTFLEHGV